MADQLIIIGNGFDLHCDLDTKFTDYFEETKPPIGDNVIKNFFNLDSYNSNIMYNTHPYFKKSSFWDIYFNLLNLDNIKDWDYIIYNNGTYEELEKNTEELYTVLKERL